MRKATRKARTVVTAATMLNLLHHLNTTKKNFCKCAEQEDMLKAHKIK